MDLIKNIAKRNFQNFLYFYSHIRYQIFIQMGLSIVMGILDGFGLAMFLPLLQTVNNSGSAELEKLGNLSFLIKGMQSLGINFKITSVLFFLVLFFLLKSVVRYICSQHQINITQAFIKKIRINLIHSLNSLSYKYFVTADAGKIQNTLSGEVDRIARGYQTYLSVFQQIILVITYMLFAFFIEPKFALLITIGAALTNLVYRRIYMNTIGVSRILTSEANKFQGLLIQYVNNFKYMKATGLISKFAEKLKSSVNITETNNRKIGRLDATLTATREPILILVVCIVIYIHINLLKGALGPILISLLFFYRALTALMQVQTRYNNFLSVSGSMVNLAEFSDKVANHQEKEGKEEITSFKGELELINATFKYGETIVLKNINLRISNKETIAFIGESGSGKTTLVNILTGLMPLDEGSFTIKNIDRADLNLTSFQNRIGYISQEPVIFNDSIFNNVTFWAEQNKENIEKFNTVICRAAINDFINNLPEKELTELGNNGINLSGGQKQRIAIARELYKDVDILVFDEATSALDSETERTIQNNIDELHGKYTMLIIAHRISTIKHADRIILMKRGEIIDQGSFSELMATSAAFRRMVELQEF